MTCAGVKYPASGESKVEFGKENGGKKMRGSYYILHASTFLLKELFQC
jgi:hypothetical protein